MPPQVDAWAACRCCKQSLPPSRVHSIAAVLSCKWDDESGIRTKRAKVEKGGHGGKRQQVAEDILSRLKSSRTKSSGERGQAVIWLRLATGWEPAQGGKCTGQRHQLLGGVWLSGKRLCRHNTRDTTEGIGTELGGGASAAAAGWGRVPAQMCSRGSRAPLPRGTAC